MVIIGIVGGIASGKSLVARVFADLGAHIIDADRIGHDILRLPQVKNQIRQIWGEDVFGLDGEIERKEIAKTVFGTDSLSHRRLAQLEQITHPLIGRQLDQQIERLRSQGIPVVILDAAVMFKSDWHRKCHRIVFVDAAEGVRIQRAEARGWSVDEFRSRERTQSWISGKDQIADAVIDNSGTVEQTRQQVERLWKRWNLAAEPNHSI